MDTLSYIIVFSLLGSLLSLIGGLVLLTKQKLALKVSHYLASFAAGALLGTAFFDLLPEALHEGGEEAPIFLWVLGGILFFFLLERFIRGFHHHHEHEENEKRSVVSLIIIGDSFHNFIDGVVIAGTFMVDINLGIVTTLAVAAHEIPQEIGDFGILLNKKVARTKVLLFNIMSALTAVAGALLTYFLGETIEGSLPLLIALTAGFFIYIAASDIIPDIHFERKQSVAVLETILLLLGVATIYGFVTLLGGH